MLSRHSAKCSANVTEMPLLREYPRSEKRSQAGGDEMSAYRIWVVNRRSS